MADLVDIASAPLSEERRTTQAFYGRIIERALRETPEHTATIVYANGRRTFGCGCDRHTGKLVGIFNLKPSDSLIVSQNTPCGLVLTYLWAIKTLLITPA